MSSVLYDAPGPRTRRRTTLWSVVGAALMLAVIAWVVLRLDSRGQFEAERWEPLTDADAGVVWRSMLIDGLGSTVRAAGVAAVIALALGVILAVTRMSQARVIRVPGTVIVEVFRGLPVVLLMFFGVLGLGLPIFWGVVFGLVIYNAAIIGEILRAGIVSLPAGQSEAAYAVGLTRMQTLFSVLLPQAVRRMLPALISQFVVLLKDTSLGFLIGYSELLRRTRLNTEFFGNQHWFQFFVVGAAIYIALNFALSQLTAYLERRGSKRAAGGVLTTAETKPGGTTGTPGGEPTP